ncbi:hypothetical protein Tco_1209852 [Tanacetum coccineum]
MLTSSLQAEKTLYTSLKLFSDTKLNVDPIYTITQDNHDRDLNLGRREEKSLIYNTSFLGEYECSSLALDRRRKKEIPTVSSGGKVDPEGGEDCGFDSNEEEVVPNVDDVSLVDGVFDGVFCGDGDEDFVIGLEEEACVDAIEVEEK